MKQVSGEILRGLEFTCFLVLCPELYVLIVLYFADTCKNTLYSTDAKESSNFHRKSTKLEHQKSKLSNEMCTKVSIN